MEDGRRIVLPSGETFFRSRRENGHYLMEWPRAGSARLDALGGTWRWIRRPPHALSRAVLESVLGGYAGSLAGRESLHATVLVKGERGIAFLGDSGAGKSTLAAAGLSRDPSLRLLTDDVMPFSLSRGRVWTRREGPPRLKLSPASPFVSEIRSRTSSSLDPNFERRVVTFPRLSRTVLLSAAVLLNRGSASVRMTPVTGARAACLYAGHFYNRLFLPDSVARSQFLLAADLARCLPLFRFSYPDGLDRIPGVFSRLDSLWT